MSKMGTIMAGESPALCTDLLSSHAAPSENSLDRNIIYLVGGFNPSERY